MRFDWTDLRVFLYSCETGSMTEAASCSNLTLAAVSARIRALEDCVGVLLLRRHARGVLPTAAGEALARHARLLFHQRDALRRDFAGSGAPQAAGTVLLANSSALARPLYRVIGDVLAGHAGAQVSARESASEVTVHALLTGAADLGLVTDAVDTDGLAVHELGADPLAGRGALSFGEALAHPSVSWGEGSALHTHLVMQASRAGAALRTAVSVPSVEGVVELVARGFGVSVLPRALLHRLDHGGQLAVLKLDEPWAERRLLVCRSPQAAGGPALALFDAFRTQWRALDASLAAS